MILRRNLMQDKLDLWVLGVAATIIETSSCRILPFCRHIKVAHCFRPRLSAIRRCRPTPVV